MENNDLMITNQAQLSPTQVMSQVQVIQQLLKKVMKEGDDGHYGQIPGTRKKTLYKAGAEKLGLLFRLSPEYEITKTDLPNYHREYEVVTTLKNIITGETWGQGVGSCSTLESKYRYRTGEVTFTGDPVPQDFWKERDIKLIGGRGHAVKKNPDTGKWEIVLQGEKMEHDNPADYYNTVLKMAKKRSHVDAMLTATAASDIFEQDVEDDPNIVTEPDKNNPEKKTIKKPMKKDKPEPEVNREPEPEKNYMPDERFKKLIEKLSQGDKSVLANYSGGGGQMGGCFTPDKGSPIYLTDDQFKTLENAIAELEPKTEQPKKASNRTALMAEIVKVAMDHGGLKKLTGHTSDEIDKMSDKEFDGIYQKAMEK